MISGRAFEAQQRTMKIAVLAECTEAGQNSERRK
jgi:hypothetical protein